MQEFRKCKNIFPLGEGPPSGTLERGQGDCFPLGEGGLRGIVFSLGEVPSSGDLKRGQRGLIKSKMVEKINGEFKHPPCPPSKEGGVIIYFPLGEGGIKGGLSPPW